MGALVIAALVVAAGELGLILDACFDGPARRLAAAEKRDRVYSFADLKAIHPVDANRIGEIRRRHQAEALEALRRVTA